ncbi:MULTISPECIES: ArsR/SmtB family transcription factor [Chryseobacterium]|uniref:DNA-binding transcriptional ArsR family regulator n=1 Tax=Chryseobacterium rhizosphaerae TaxID=395937 RepID=A0AAE3Y8U4_9FLAO|nr:MULTISPECIES: winged helix-turn-helix domain-containing protein [Chryseobacterium]MDC8100726.1 winged helix-turn-helix domain-containing protein [Chryseobacterium rhizosphaerae]MDR6525756.1 DNA-binding transcriptional ArsR family regulator [Chryseobacterium rhizosphaerae]SMC61306.1 DNA-binding transcriptional regulator, ArsR family [Chryseobacterium sp. YR221]
MEKEIGYITSLIGDPIRTTILWSLLDNKAYTATELAIHADTSPQNISMHLNKLVQADLLTVERQGRHKYYRFSKPEVAYAIEAIGNLIPNDRHKKIVSNTDNSSIKYCRTCYDHLAGKVGVLLTEALLTHKIIDFDVNTYIVTKSGTRFFAELEVNIEDLKKQRRAFARPCLDWSERKHHLAGSLGAALLDKMLSLDYVRRTKNSRAILLTSKGKQYLYERFKISV